MRTLQLSLSLVAAVSLLGATGCAARVDDSTGGDDTEAEDALALHTTVAPGTFKLYDDPGHLPSGCDVYEQLVLSNGSRGATAKLTDLVGGMCMIAIAPNEREYHLHQTGGTCGTKIYEAKRHLKDGAHSVKITDNRARTCFDAVAARVIVEETVPGFPGAITTTKYSDDAAAAVDETFEGTLVTSEGIGGENTGRSIDTKTDGRLELVLTTKQDKSFADGRRARVIGTRTFLSGVETHDRPAVDVSDILVCPAAGASVDCMPVTHEPLCESGKRAWVTANCTGVHFTD